MVNGLDVLRGEVAHVSMATAPPAQRIGAVNEFDDITTQEAQLGGVVGGEVEESVGVMGTLWGGEERTKERGMEEDKKRELMKNWLHNFHAT